MTLHQYEAPLNSAKNTRHGGVGGYGSTTSGLPVCVHGDWVLWEKTLTEADSSRSLLVTRRHARACQRRPRIRGRPRVTSGAVLTNGRELFGSLSASCLESGRINNRCVLGAVGCDRNSLASPRTAAILVVSARSDRPSVGQPYRHSISKMDLKVHSRSRSLGTDTSRTRCSI